MKPLLLFFVALSFFVSGNNNSIIRAVNVVKGSGNVVSTEISVSDYTIINSFGSGDIVYEQRVSAAPYLRLEIDDNLAEFISIKTEADELIIKSEKNIHPTRYKIYTNSTLLKDIHCLGSGDVILKTEINTDNLKLAMVGSGDIDALSLNTKNLEISITGSSDVDLGGKTDNLQIRLSGSGDIDAFGLSAQNASCRISGSGDVTLDVSGVLDARIRGSGDIRYKGSPKEVNKSVSGVGSVKSAK